MRSQRSAGRQAENWEVRVNQSNRPPQPTTPLSSIAALGVEAGREWSRREPSDMDEAPSGVSERVRANQSNRLPQPTTRLSSTAALGVDAGAGMDPAGAERYGRSPVRGERVGASASIEPDSTTYKPRCPAQPRSVLRRGRESNPRMEVLQTSALPLGYPAALCERRISWHMPTVSTWT